MIIYISGKITNNIHYIEDFKKAELLLKSQGHKVINTAEIGASLQFLSYEQFMQLDYKLIDLSDGIYILNNYKSSKGAKAEFSYAKSLNKKIIFEKDV